MGNFIPKTYKKQAVTVRIDEKNLTVIDQLAQKMNISRSEIISQCLDYAISDLDDIVKAEVKK